MRAKPLPDPLLPWPIAMAGVAEIAASEGLRLKAYRCPAGVWTIGWGETDGVHPGDTCSKDDADRWLCEDLADRARRVRALCAVRPGDNELAAMVSLAYNIGLDGLARSTVLRQHNAGNPLAAARAFGLWNKARNPRTQQLEVLPGLTARRAREAALYLTPDHAYGAEPMPQAVQGDASLLGSPIAQGGAATAATGALAGVAAVGEQVSAALPAADQAGGMVAALAAASADVRAAAHHAADFLGLPPAGLLAAVLLGVGAVVLFQRWRQRAEGWA